MRDRKFSCQQCPPTVQEMAAAYGDDVSRPAQTAREAVQWVYCEAVQGGSSLSVWLCVCGGGVCGGV